MREGNVPQVEVGLSSTTVRMGGVGVGGVIQYQANIGIRLDIQRYPNLLPLPYM